METRLIPSIRKFKELGVSSPKEINSLAEIDQTAKNMDYIAFEFTDKEKT
jgi:hypothetical protein